MNLTDTNGRPTAYALACGYVDKREFDSDNRVTLEREHGVYHLKGFEAGVHFWHSFAKLTEARQKMYAIALRIARNRR